MNKVAMLGISLVALFMVGCQSVAIRDDLAKVEAGNASTIAKDWSALIATQFNVSTVFVLKGQGAIGQALAEALRKKGYGVSSFSEAEELRGTTLEVRTDKIGKKGVLVSLVVDKNIINRSYRLTTEGMTPNSRFTQLTSKGGE
ncbi:MAG: hypothetical protein C0631_15570 [Sedimenticola sp.]|nr:MAG: hypothetical protein C0631_15570 [Sedimenticola sp.]